MSAEQPVHSPSKLDGTEDIKPVPFDAHEQVVRHPHEHSLEEGYERVGDALPPTSKRSPDLDLKLIQQYPKAVAHDPNSGEPIVAANAAEEKEILARIKDQEKEQEADK